MLFSLSNGEPFRIDPSPCTSSAWASPWGIALSFLGSAGAMPAGVLSAAETAASGFAFGLLAVGIVAWPFICDLLVLPTFGASFDISAPSREGTWSVEAICPLGSTDTKLVRTLLNGLGPSLTTLPEGERPREGGEVLLVSC